MTCSVRFELKCICYDKYDITEKRLLVLSDISQLELRELLNHGAVKKDGVLFYVERIIEGKNYVLNQLTFDFETQQTVYRGARAFKGKDSKDRFNSFCKEFESKGWESRKIDYQKNLRWRDDNS